MKIAVGSDHAGFRYKEILKAALVARYGPQRWPGIAVDVDPLSVM